MSNREDDFRAGIAFAVVVVDFLAVISQYHKYSPASHVSGWDVIAFVLLMVIFASCSIDLYNYWKRGKKPKESSVAQIHLDSADAVEKFMQ